MNKIHVITDHCNVTSVASPKKWIIGFSDESVSMYSHFYCTLLSYSMGLSVKCISHTQVCPVWNQSINPIWVLSDWWFKTSKEKRTLKNIIIFLLFIVKTTTGNLNDNMSWLACNYIIFFAGMTNDLECHQVRASQTHKHLRDPSSQDHDSVLWHFICEDSWNASARI